ncbi:MAG: hypothetical protein IKE92_05435 [Clostridiales bacterium]|nr:hypothetical protein [Clostridiales bacterium]
MNEQWQELKETITEMRDNDGTGTQQEVCKFLVNLMDILEKQMQEPKTGHWIKSNIPNEKYICSECGGASWYYDYQGDVAKSRYCPNCGEKMVEPQERGDKE